MVRNCQNGKLELGIPPDHSTTIGHILNLRSSFISPQYHVIYDDRFSTVPNSESGGMLEPELDGNFWCKLITTGYKSLLHDDDDESLPDLHPDWLTDAELRVRTCDHTSTRLHPTPPLPLPFPPVPSSVAGGNLANLPNVPNVHNLHNCNLAPTDIQH